MASLEEGQRFGRYQLLRRIGYGISGESYEAEDTQLQRKVILKRIHHWAPLPDAARRQFFRELQRISSLTHPSIAAILDYGEIESQLYLARYYVGPGSLLGSNGRLWFRPPLPIPIAIRYAYQLAQTLQYIHDAGYVHGSLTLANILIPGNPAMNNELDFAPLLIADIGLAHFVRRFGQLQKQSQALLFPVTAAPEQSGKRTLPASDQYALAVLLYLWLAGRPPFLGSAEEITKMKQTETIPSFATLNAAVTIEQENILRRALQIYPDERYSSIIAFAEALLATLEQPMTMLDGEALAVHTQVIENRVDVEAATKQNEQARSLQEPALPQPHPQPIPDVPQPMPAPEPIPTPDPIPQPDPQPLPRPSQEPLPETPPEVLPPGPDIAQPLPDTTPTSPPETLPQTEPSKPDDLSLAQSPALAPHFIIVSSQVQVTRIVLLEQDEITLGCAGSSTILLDQDTLTSRYHALLKRDGEHYIIYGQHSTHEIFVNGQQLSEGESHTLTDGDVVGIGEYALFFRFLS